MKILVAAILSVFLVACGGSDKASPLHTSDDAPRAATTSATTSSSSQTPSTAAIATSSAQSGLPSLSSAVDKIRPATVQVTNEATTRIGQTGTSLDVPQGTGTGFIYDNQGHVMTNAHVVAGATTLLVTTANGEAQEAKLIGADPRTDIAVLQIKGSSLPVAALGDPSKLKVGDWTVALGHALGLPGGPTVTAGVLSATGRHVQEPSDTNGAGPYLFDMLQTDAPINPGNSGGPLVNINGEVIGMNTLIAGEAEAGVPSQGIGFAIPMNRAKDIADQLVKNGSVAHASLGVSFAPVNPAIALQLGAKEGTKGAAIGQVAQGSAAAKAGLRSKDIITRVDNTDVKEESDLPRLIDQKKPGDKVTLTVLRSGSEQKVEATLDKATS